MHCVKKCKFDQKANELKKNPHNYQRNNIDPYISFKKKALSKNKI